MLLKVFKETNIQITTFVWTNFNLLLYTDMWNVSKKIDSLTNVLWKCHSPSLATGHNKEGHIIASNASDWIPLLVNREVWLRRNLESKCCKHFLTPLKRWIGLSPHQHTEVATEISKMRYSISCLYLPLKMKRQEEAKHLKAAYHIFSYPACLVALARYGCS